MTIPQKSHDIQRFIAANVGTHPRDIAMFAANAVGKTTSAIHHHMGAMVEHGTLIATGATRGRRYALRPLAKAEYKFKTKDLAEDDVWLNYLVQHMNGLARNVTSVLELAVTELVQNVIDHSDSATMTLRILRTIAFVEVMIVDSGVGVFRKVRDGFDLCDERKALFEICKGKVSTTPEEHSGHGIFFAARMVDTFQVRSGNLVFTHSRDQGDWSVEVGDETVGTSVSMIVATDNTETPQSVYDQFCGGPNGDDQDFHKTHVPLQLAQFGGETLISRSQAKRVLARLDQFTDVTMDFHGIDRVGQAFIDEIFRVFRLQHPGTSVVGINANRRIRQLIRSAQAAEREHHSDMVVAGAA